MAKILKRPFKPPLAPRHDLQQYLGITTASFIPDTDMVPSSPSRPMSSPFPAPSPFPTFQNSFARRYTTKRLAQPFKSPSIVNTRADTNEPPSSDPVDIPSSPTLPHKRTLGRSIKPLCDGPSRQNQISALESKRQVLTQALRILQEPSEEVKLTELREQWLAVGREISEKLFSVIPEPTHDDLWQDEGSDKVLGTSGRAGDMRVTEQSQSRPLEDWTIGTMLRGLSVDPCLFGWDSEDEDWQDLS